MAVFQLSLSFRAGMATLGSSFCNRIGSVPKQSSHQVRSIQQTRLAMYKVQLISPSGEKTVKMTGGKSILSQALQENIDVPNDPECRSGNCLGCIGKLVKGKVNHSDQRVLEPADLDKGFVVLCRAHPASDVVIETHVDVDDMLDVDES